MHDNKRDKKMLLAKSRPSEFPKIDDWSRDFGGKRKPVEAAQKEILRGKRAFPTSGVFVSFTFVLMCA